MRSRYVVIIAIIIAIFSICIVNCEETSNISNQCTYKNSNSNRKIENLIDSKYTSFWESSSTYNPFIEVAAPIDIPIYGVYICFAELPDEWELQVENNGKWENFRNNTNNFLHEYIPLNGVSKYKIIVTSTKLRVLKINEIFTFSNKNIPNWVQQWENTPSKCDILFLVAHPDDEFIFMGGAIPDYAIEQKRNIVIAYMTAGNSTRSSELLNALWHLGYKNYPVIGSFRDGYSFTTADAYGIWGKGKAREFVISLFRKVKPEVVVSHDLDGEYGHGAHKITAELAMLAFDKAANSTDDVNSLSEYGQWQVKKLYLHLYNNKQIKLNWSKPLKSFNNKTGENLASEALSFHTTQTSNAQDFDKLKIKYDYELFGLAKTVVGDDVNKNNFLENIYDSTTKKLIKTPVKQSITTNNSNDYKSLIPKLNQKGFLYSDEFIYSNDEQGIWIYISQSLNINIIKKYDTKINLTWYEADIKCDIEKGEMLRAIPYDENNIGKFLVDPSVTAQKNNVVFGFNSDYFTYRRGGERSKGIDIRNKTNIIYDDPYDKPTTRFPNLDTMAFFEDGRIEVFENTLYKAQDFINMGAVDVFSFGPYLIKNGEINNKLFKVRLWDMLNPRLALGMIEPGHYFCVMCEGRLKDSKGIDLDLLSKIMLENNCQTAFNLDGGQTAVMLFMGKQINRIGVYDGKINPRKTSEIIGIGRSDKVEITRNLNHKQK